MIERLDGIKLDAIIVDPDSWARIEEATGGAANPCYACSTCTALCPWTELRGQGANIRSLIRHAQLGLTDNQDLLWLCTTCGACESRCPRGVDVSRVILGLRHLAWRERRVPEGLSPVLWGVLNDGNPWGGAPSKRTEWAKGIDLPAYSPRHDFLYYTGCTSSYDPRSQRIARSLVRIFQKAGLKFGSLGEDEPCCGDAAYSLGNLSYLERLAGDNIRKFEEMGVRRVVSTSPHCSHLFTTAYPREKAGFEAEHYTGLLERLLDEGRLDFAVGGPGLRVAYHDPCYLGRKMGIYDAPRRVLSSIPGVELVEFEENRDDASCCGGGGGRMWQETEAGERLGDRRVEEARDMKADMVVTACPHCVACFEDGAKALGSGAPGIFDLAEVVARALVEEVGLLVRPGAQRASA